MTRILMGILLVGMVTSTCGAQNVKVKVRAALYDRDLNLKPVPHLTVKLVPVSGGSQTVTVQTTLDGIAEADLQAGNYHVVTDSPVELFDKSYRWEVDVSFTRPENTLELSNDNAKTTSLAGSREARVDELVYQYKRVKSGVVRVQTEVATIDGLLVDSAGLVLTAQHPLEQATWLAVQVDDNRKLPAVVLATDKQQDFAVLRINPGTTGPLPISELSPDPGSLIEGERVFTIETAVFDKKRQMHTGVISRADVKEIVCDAKVSRPGGPLFNSSGSVVGITQYADRKLRIAPVSGANETLAEARRKLASESAPPFRLLPTVPSDSFPGDKLHAPGRGHWEKEFYAFKAGDFDVELVTPVAQYETDTETYEAEMRDYHRHPKGSAPVEPGHDYDVVLRVAVIPKTKMPFWENMANSSFSNRRAPTILRYKNGFAKMRLLCGEKEVDPIWPGRVTEGTAHSWDAVLVDESSGGRYVYPHDSISPQCGQVKLQIFSTKDPNVPLEKVLDARQVTRIWEDFEAYRQLRAQRTDPAQQ